ncbi:RsmB/NOP family class I SAM-dependent RNA methyltransferase [Wenxinia saemankumensis]|uniref:16S rRNA (Cytosine967-C5)-methyltransferase n=1 Tax=Wenxinia saemankumensis TaxID=1447782 RepID=A0A1M6HCV4_9RHOB|nr:RsmB/NOP family class I SAM-dependent RNA methyltransferase [Wenxinia saemankumensis]SHJ19919.1 16S rRNA (cytosine967-C5)-methyltransferase [Wenxinia saemankumensis]
MTPGARAAAAISVLDDWLDGAPVERALLRWARGARYAGSGDRAAVRDLVYDAVRRRRSAAAAGGALTGRGLVLGTLRLDGTDPATLFTGQGHAPPPLDEGERPGAAPADRGTRLDWPDWLLPHADAALGAGAEAALAAQRDRAPVFLRALGDRGVAAERLAEEGISVSPLADVATALEVTRNARRVAASAAFREGLIDLQDASSQAAILSLPLAGGETILDYCAGGGGKSLAVAARGAGRVVAHDADPARMADIAPRALRLGAEVEVVPDLPPGLLADLVIVDAPCSGSGTWRRAPEAKWRLTPDRLAELTALQDDILAEAARHVRPGGILAYMTCSIFRDENEDRVNAARAGWAADWQSRLERRWIPGPGGDGFYLALLARP